MIFRFFMFEVLYEVIFLFLFITDIYFRRKFFF